MNPRAAINDLLPFQGSPFDLLGISPKALPNELYVQGNIRKRRGWDSNPCAPKDKRFSRPPRYDRFDTSPYRTRCFMRSVSCILLKLISLSPFAERKRYTTKPFLLCQTKFYPISTSVSHFSSSMCSLVRYHEHLFCQFPFTKCLYFLNLSCISASAFIHLLCCCIKYQTYPNICMNQLFPPTRITTLSASQDASMIDL